MFALCEHAAMTETAWTRFVERQLAALKELGLSPEALARERALLQSGVLQTAWLAALAQRRDG